MPKPLRVIEGTAEPYQPFWRFRDAAESESGETELEFFGPISEFSWFGDEITPALFKGELYAKGQGNPVTMLINSPGGEVIAASVIRSILQDYPGHVTADIVGLAASAATIVVTGADHVRMRESALFMIHEASVIAWGNVDELKKTIEELKTVNDSIVNTYQAKTGMEPARLTKLMHDETWMTAKEAKDYGFVDEVVSGSLKKPPANMAAGYINCLRNFAHVPTGLLNELPVTTAERGVAQETVESPEEAELRHYLQVFA